MNTSKIMSRSVRKKLAEEATQLALAAANGVPGAAERSREIMSILRADRHLCLEG